VFRITAILVAAVSDTRKDRTTFKHWLGESFSVEVALPRKALGVPVLNEKRLPHSTVGAPDTSLWFVHFDAPNMPATVTYRFVLFHRISVSAPLEPLRFGSKGHKLKVSCRARRLGAGRPFCFRGSLPSGCVALPSFAFL
jgi:hypothetical protein